MIWIERAIGVMALSLLFAFFVSCAALAPRCMATAHSNIVRWTFNWGDVLGFSILGLICLWILYLVVIALTEHYGLD